MSTTKRRSPPSTVRERTDEALSTVLPTWIKPQLAALVKKAPEGDGWLHEIKLDGYRMHARLDAGRVQLLTRRGNDWTIKYPAISSPATGASSKHRRRIK
jgi:bifunctional non-homologous end joining protein LigD